MHQAPSAATDPRLALESVAAKLVHLEPDDKSGLGELRTTLTQFAYACALEPTLAAVSAPVEQVLECIDAMLAGKPHSDFAELHRLFEATQRAVENGNEARLADVAASPATTAPAEAPTLIEEPASTSNAAYEALLMKPDVLSSEVDAELVDAFVTECRETLAGAEAALLQLEQVPDHPEAINTVFRVFHTIKGTSAFLGLARVTDLAHEAENLLSRMRDGTIRCVGRNADLVLRSIDVLRVCANNVGETKPGQSVPVAKGIGELRQALLDTRSQPSAPVETDAEAEPTNARPAADASNTGETGAKTSTSSQESSVRVRTDRLDRLIDMVGELVIAQSLVSQDEVVVSGEHSALARKTTHAGKIVRELQDLSMSLRMLPLRATFQKMSRIVRDAARRTGKKVRFVSQGEDTEVDRNMVDVVGDPLVHMVRNAVDHGLEPPSERTAAGKGEEGSVCLRAYHAGGHVVIEIQEDGRGLDRKKIAAKAIEKGLIENDDGMSDQDVYQLLFAPGFSTAAVVTEMSGRGVGLDVVKRNVESLKGRISISTQLGHGTTFSLRLPLTLAITDGMLVRVGSQRYIVPTTSIRQSLRPRSEDVITVEGRGQMLRLRGEVLAIYSLGELLSLSNFVTNPTKGLLVVVHDGDHSFALLVDELLGQQQVVTKPIGDLKNVRGVSGGAILGDGTVGLILDPSSVARMAQLASEERNLRLAANTAHEPAHAAS